MLLALFFCVGFAGRAEAMKKLALPVSIHEILSPEQIREVRASAAVRSVQQGIKQQAMTEQVGTNAKAMRNAIGMGLGSIISSQLSTQVERKVVQKTEEFDSEPAVQTTPSL